jgi:hypothetical protein
VILKAKCSENLPNLQLVASIAELCSRYDIFIDPKIAVIFTNCAVYTVTQCYLHAKLIMHVLKSRVYIHGYVLFQNIFWSVTSNSAQSKQFLLIKRKCKECHLKQMSHCIICLEIGRVPKVSNHPLGENSPNMVTLVQNQSLVLFKFIVNWSQFFLILLAENSKSN